MDVYVNSGVPVDFDDKPGSATVPATSVETEVVGLWLKSGKRAFLRSCGQDWDAAMDTYCSWVLRVNGAICYPRSGFTTVQLQAPGAGEKSNLPVRMELPQGGYVSLVMKSSVEGLGVGRLVIEYEDYGG